MENLCKNCRKMWTSKCPIRVWGRHEGNNFNVPFIRDVNPEKDFCSRFEKKEKYNE